MLVSYALLRTSRVQTWLVHKFTKNLSERLKTRVEIKGVDFEFVKTLVLEDIFIGDQHQDTILYAQKLKVDVAFLGFRDQWLVVDELSLLNAHLKMKKYAGEHDMAYSFLLDALEDGSGKNKKTSTSHWKVDLNAIVVTNMEFVYDFKQNKDTAWGFNLRNIRASSINARLTGIKLHGDTIHTEIVYLSAKERSGFLLNSMSAVAELSMRCAEFNDMKIVTPHTTINADMMLTFHDPHDLESFEDSVNMKAVFRASKIEVGDIAYFEHDLRGIHQKVELKSGTITGRVNNLKGKNLNIALGAMSRFSGDVSFQGLPDIPHTYITLKAKEVWTSKKDLELLQVPPFLKGGRLELPDNFSSLGAIHFKGTMEGFLDEFVADGEFNTALGTVASDISLKKSAGKRMSYNGTLNVKDFNVGRFFSLTGFGRLSVSGQFKGEDLGSADGEIALKDGVAQYLELNDYVYKNIRFDGSFSRKQLKGGLSIEDENINLRYKGNIDFKGKAPVFDFSAEVREANLAALHFYHGGQNATLSAKCEVNMTGSNLDNFIGGVDLRNVEYVQDNKKALLPEIRILSSGTEENKVLSLNSDYIDATITGMFTLLDIPSYTRKLFAAYLPAGFRIPAPSSGVKNKKHPEEFSFNVVLKNTDMLSALFIPAISAAHNSTLSGAVHASTSGLKLDAASRVLHVYNTTFEDWSLHAGNNPEKKMEVNTESSRMQVSDSIGVDQFSLHTTGAYDTLKFNLNWENETKKRYAGNLKAFMYILSPEASVLHLTSANIFMEDSLWKETGRNIILFDSGKVIIHDLGFSNSHQAVQIDGRATEEKNDFLNIGLAHFNLASLNPMLRSSGLSLKGIADGKISISDIWHTRVFTSSYTFNGLQVNNDTIGSGGVESVWDKKKEALYLHGNFSQGFIPDMLFSGYYYPSRSENSLDFELDLNRLSFSLFKPYVKEYCKNFEGRFSGNLALKGSLKKPVFSGTVIAQGDKVTLTYLNTNYHFTDQLIRVEENNFLLTDFVVLDEYDNKAIVRNGRLHHDHFTNFVLNFPIETNHFMCLNTTENDNSDYYGTAFVSGPVNVSGTLDNLLIEASVKTEKYFDKKTNRTHYTHFFVPLENTQEVSKVNYIRFVTKDSVKAKNNYKVNLNGIAMNFSLELTPDANIQLIFDQKVGDVIKSKGAGNIAMNINTLGKFSMLGDYTIESGEYLFTLKNLINKKFKIEKGGTISWSGDPKDATINLKADYQVRASLKPVVQTDTSGRRYPVNCIMGLSGSLLQPNINFDIDLPTVDETTRQEVKRTINNEQEVNRQVLALLVLNNFVPPLGWEGQNSGTGAVNTTTSELLSNQLSNWLSQISNDFDLRVKYRPGDQVNRDEMELALSTQVLNDRLTVDGSVMSGATQKNTTNNLVGDLSVEYKLTKNGKLRLKAYNKTNDNTVLNADAPYSQGVGLAYKEEFNTVGELMRRFRDRLRRHKPPVKLPPGPVK
ncbi:MAG: translocation/assembly module TamB domain-containing protein [Bacteroidia bacterium]